MGSIILKILNSKIIKIENNCYNITIYKAGEVNCEILNNDSLIKSIKFVAKSLPNPYAIIFPNINPLDGQIELKDVIKINKITAPIIGFGFDYEFRIKSFKMMTLIDSEYIELNSENQYLSVAQKDVLKSMKIGDVLIFKDIISEGPEGLIRRLNDIVLTIK